MAVGDKNGNSVALLGAMAAGRVDPLWPDRTFHSLSAWCLEAEQTTEFLNTLRGGMGKQLLGGDTGIAANIIDLWGLKNNKLEK